MENVTCSNGHSNPIENAFCNICGAPIAPAIPVAQCSQGHQLNQPGDECAMCVTNGAAKSAFRPSSRKPLIAIVSSGIIVALVVALMLTVFSSDSPIPIKKTKAPRAAIVLDSTIQLSSATRQQENSAYSQIQTCANMTQAIAQLTNAVATRHVYESNLTEASQGASVTMQTVITQFLSVLNYSVQVDQSYISWAQYQQQYRCSSYSYGYSGPDYHRTQTTQLATLLQTAKDTFCNQWNPIAGQYKLEFRVSSQI